MRVTARQHCIVWNRRWFSRIGTTQPVGHPSGSLLLNVLGQADAKSVTEMYNLYMSELAVSEARNRLAEAIELARSGEPVYVTRRGHRVAVLVDAASYDALVESAEDAVDRAELEAARLEDDYVPWEEVKADLGLR